MAEQNQDPGQQGNPGDQQQEDRPEWLPEKFKDPQALVNSYTEMERRLTDESNSRRALEDAFTEMSSQMEALQSQQNQPNLQQAQEWVAENYGFDQQQLQLMAQLASNIADTKLKAYQESQKPNTNALYEASAYNAEAELRAILPDWNDYRDKVAETIQQFPHLVPEDHLASPVALRNDLLNVYKLVRSDDVEKQATEAQQRAAEFERMKENAQTLTGGIGRPMAQSEADAEWAKVKAAGTREGGY